MKTNSQTYKAITSSTTATNIPAIIVSMTNDETNPK